jgi:hypothetical protein
MFEYLKMLESSDQVKNEMTTERTDACFVNVKEIENLKESNQSKNI